MDLLGSNGLKEQKSEERSEKKIMDAIHFQKLELQFWELVHILLYGNHFSILQYQLMILKNIL